MEKHHALAILLLNGKEKIVMKYSSCYIPRLLYWIAALSFTSLRLKTGILEDKSRYLKKN